MDFQNSTAVQNSLIFQAKNFVQLYNKMSKVYQWREMAYIFEKSVPKHNTSKNGGIPSGILDFISKGKKGTISRLATRQFLRWLLDDKVFFCNWIYENCWQPKLPRYLETWKNFTCPALSERTVISIGTHIQSTQCRNFKICLPLRFYVKSILMFPEVQNLPFLRFLGFE